MPGATRPRRCFPARWSPRRLHAQRLRPVDRGRVHQQHVLDRRHRADRVVGSWPWFSRPTWASSCCPTSRRRRVATTRSTTRRATTASAACLRASSRASGWWPAVVGAVRRRPCSAWAWSRSSSSRLRPARSVGRSADALRHVDRADECRHRQGRGLAGQADRSEDRHGLRRPRARRGSTSRWGRSCPTRRSRRSWS